MSQPKGYYGGGNAQGKRASKRVRKLLTKQNCTCSCGERLTLHNLVHTNKDDLICNTCNLKRLGLIKP